MTNEEAIKALSLMEHVESIVATYEPGEIRNDTTVRELREACRVAITALSAQQDPVELDRSRWEQCEGCELCQNDYAVYHIFSHYKFCPMCGRPLTEEAWTELERRINGGAAD